MLKTNMNWADFCDRKNSNLRKEIIPTTIFCTGQQNAFMEHAVLKRAQELANVLKPDTVSYKSHFKLISEIILRFTR